MSNDHREDHEFRRAGSLLPKIVDSVKPSVSTPGTSSPNSGTTGLPRPAPAGPSSTGLQRGALGVAALLNGDNPTATDNALMASLPPSVAPMLVPVDREFYDEQYGYDFEFSHFDLVAPLSPDDRRASLRIVDAALAPDLKTIFTELARLRMLTKARMESDASTEAMASVYAEEMNEYPPDVVRAACRGWSRREKWWPSWAELKSELDRHVRKRRALAAVLARVD